MTPTYERAVRRWYRLHKRLYETDRLNANGTRNKRAIEIERQMRQAERVREEHYQ